MEVNKGEAERCRDMGAEAMRSGNLVRAVKLLSKSLQLYPLPGVDALLAQTMARVQQSQNASSTSSSAPRTQPTAQPPHRASSTASATSSSSAKTGRDGRAYTEDQVAICSQVLRAKEGGRGAHYRVLGISPSSDESQIKKGYRKLSLKVHPDKNSAPHSDEAFKAVGLAYATLSDPQKRTIYDRYGEEDPDNLGGGGARRAGGMHMHQGQNVSPEEIFNMFFGGGMGGGGGGGGGPGFHFQSNGFGPGMQFRQQRQRGGGQGQRREAQQQQQQQQQPSFGMLFQLLPIILILVVSFFKFDDAASVAGGSMPGVDRYFSLTHKGTFNNPLATRLTPVKDIPYFVTDQFKRTYYRDRYQLAQVERMVEKAYEQYLVDECKGQQTYRSRLVKRAQSEEDPEEAVRKLKLAEEFEMSRCVELGDLFPKRADKQGAKSGKRSY